MKQYIFNCKLMQIFAIKDYLLCTTRAKLSIDFTFFYQVDVMHTYILYSNACFCYSYSYLWCYSYLEDVQSTLWNRSKQMMRKVTVGKTVLLASWKSSLRKSRLPDSVQNSIYTVFYSWLCGMGFAHCWRPYGDL